MCVVAVVPYFRLDMDICDFWDTVTDCTEDGIRFEAIRSVREVAPASEMHLPQPDASASFSQHEHRDQHEQHEEYPNNEQYPENEQYPDKSTEYSKEASEYFYDAGMCYYKLVAICFG